MSDFKQKRNKRENKGGKHGEKKLWCIIYNDQRNHNRILHGIEMLIMNISIPQQDIGIRISLPAGITSLQLHYILNYIINSIISFSFFLFHFFLVGVQRMLKNIKKTQARQKRRAYTKLNNIKNKKKQVAGRGLTIVCACSRRR